MNVELINPFIKSVYNCMETMVGIAPVRLAPFLKENALAQGDITGIIGFAEKNVFGSVSLSFPSKTALSIYNRTMNETETRLTREVQDLTGELANIVVGGAKKEFAKSGLTFHISIPTIVVGKNHTIHHQIDTPVIVIPFKMDEDEFMLEVTMKIDRRIKV